MPAPSADATRSENPDPQPPVRRPTSTTPPDVAPAPSIASAAPVSAPRFDAAYLRNPAPEYPRASRRLGEQGRVVLRVRVEPDGSPSQLEVQRSSGSPRLDDAALDAVRRWSFVAARRGDEKVAAWVLVPMEFRLNGS
ncbi:MAG TPA: energy transducer TonB [Zeimonas sp.]